MKLLSRIFLADDLINVKIPQGDSSPRRSRATLDALDNLSISLCEHSVRSSPCPTKLHAVVPLLVFCLLGLQRVGFGYCSLTLDSSWTAHRMFCKSGFLASGNGSECPWNRTGGSIRLFPVSWMRHSSRRQPQNRLKGIMQSRTC